MIAKLAGIVDSLGEDWLILDVGGVGYLAFCSARTLRAMPGIGEAAKLYIETHVREDHIHLYGFADQTEQRWFNLLQTVQGVGAKLALGVLSSIGPAELAQAIAVQDVAYLTRANGVGKKLAQRLATELKDKVEALVGTVPGAAAAPLSVVAGGAASDAISALVNLGYRRVDAAGAVASAGRSLGENAAVEALIKSSLKELAR